jgi:hypothetical protein
MSVGWGEDHDDHAPPTRCTRSFLWARKEDSLSSARPTRAPPLLLALLVLALLADALSSLDFDQTLLRSHSLAPLSALYEIFATVVPNQFDGFVCFGRAAGAVYSPSYSSGHAFGGRDKRSPRDKKPLHRGPQPFQGAVIEGGFAELAAVETAVKSNSPRLPSGSILRRFGVRSTDASNALSQRSAPLALGPLCGPGGALCVRVSRRAAS